MAELVRLLAHGGYDGLLAVEIDHLHPDYGYDEHSAVRQSIDELRRLVAPRRWRPRRPSPRPDGSPKSQNTGHKSRFFRRNIVGCRVSSLWIETASRRLCPPRARKSHRRYPPRTRQLRARARPSFRGVPGSRAGLRPST